MKVLVACEYSAIVRDAFRRHGHDAWSCDLVETEGDPRFHIKGCALKASAQQNWDLLIAHPPCTYLANSGVRWLYEKENRWQDMNEAAFFSGFYGIHHAQSVWLSKIRLCINTLSR